MHIFVAEYNLEPISDLEVAETKHGHHFEEGGGHSHKGDHHSSHGEKGDKGYKTSHHHDKGGHGKHGKDHHSGHYSDHGGHKKKHHDEAGHYGEHHESGKGHKAGKLNFPLRYVQSLLFFTSQENSEKRKGIRRDKRPQVTTTNPTRTITIRNTNSTMTTTKEDTTASTAIIMDTTARSTEDTRREVATSPDTMMIITERRGITIRDTTRTIIRDTMASTDMTATTPTTKITGRRAVILAERNTDLAAVIIKSLIIVYLLLFVDCSC